MKKLLAVLALVCGWAYFAAAQVTSIPCNQLPALTGDVTTAAGSCASTLAAGSASNLNSGTLPAARMPALTGDCTTSAGAVATSCTNRQTIGNATPASLAAGTTTYMGICCNFNGSALENVPVALSGSFKNLYVVVANAPGVGQTYTFTLYTGTGQGTAGLAASTLTCQISGGSATTCNDTTHTVSISAGQVWILQVVSSAGAASVSGTGYAMQFNNP